jgi:hypothetical protein
MKNSTSVSYALPARSADSNRDYFYADGQMFPRAKGTDRTGV